MKPETRVINAEDLRGSPELVAELRANPGRFTERRFASVEFQDGEGGTARGHAAVFDDLSDDLGGFRERIARGAFRKVLRDNPDVVALFNHDPNLILGRTTAGTLRLKEDSRGLQYEVDLPDTTAGRDLATNIALGNIRQSSFAFRVADEDWTEEGDELVRTIFEFERLFDVSPVTTPAYPTTNVSVRGDNTDTTEEQAGRADAQEPDQQADVEGRSEEEESSEAQDGLSPVAARLRISELTARL